MLAFLWQIGNFLLNSQHQEYTLYNIIIRKMTQEEKTKIEERIVDVLKTVYDPEIPVDIWNLGMIYKIDVKDDGTVDMDMTFTAPRRRLHP